MGASLIHVQRGFFRGLHFYHGPDIRIAYRLRVPQKYSRSPWRKLWTLLNICILTTLLSTLKCTIQLISARIKLIFCPKYRTLKCNLNNFSPLKLRIHIYHSNYKHKALKFFIVSKMFIYLKGAMYPIIWKDSEKDNDHIFE